PYRSGAKEYNNPVLKRTRRLIETTFSKLTVAGSEHTCTRSLTGLRAQIESIIMTHNLRILGNGNVTN
ncbi:IS982 family transposase, partial [Ligilactobacillus agilis]|nr:IS982 family transposase [Ligilactobacillus agilis]